MEETSGVVDDVVVVAAAVNFSSRRRILLATFVGFVAVIVFITVDSWMGDGDDDDDEAFMRFNVFTLTSADERGVVSHEEDVCELNTTELDDVSDGDDDDVVALKLELKLKIKTFRDFIGKKQS